VDDVVAVREDETDLLIINSICMQLELVSGAILKRYHQMSILGLGRWIGRGTWALSWVSALSHLKTFGVTFAPSWASPISLSGEDCLGRLQGAIQAWRDRVCLS
jgi:hypothetical protein